MGTKKKTEFYQHATCHICGYPIPPSLVDQTHPLFGTIDHVAPRSAGGRDSPENRLPSHRYCNGYKGSRGITLEIAEHCRGVIQVDPHLHAHILHSKVRDRKHWIKVLKKLTKKVNAAATAALNPEDRQSQYCNFQLNQIERSSTTLARAAVARSFRRCWHTSLRLSLLSPR